MIVYDLHVIGISIVPAKANAPLIVNPDAVLPQSVSTQWFQPIPRGHSQRVEIWSRIDHPQLAHGRPFDITGQLSRMLSLE
jgi:hypothetical protein